MNQDKTGHMIATARKELNLTQKALAEKIGISDKAISKWERGLSFPDIAVLQQLALVLGLPVIDLVTGEYMEEESHGTAAVVVNDAVEISNTELIRKKRQYLRRLIIISVCAVIVFCVIGFTYILVTLPADSQLSVKEIQARTFPSNHVLTIPMNTKTNPGDFFAFGFMLFASKTNVTLMQENLEQLFGEENVSIYHSIGSDNLYPRLLIKQHQDDGTVDFYCLNHIGTDCTRTRYIFTGMQYKFDYGQSDPAIIILPMHLIGDRRICERNSLPVICGAEYELHPISIDNSEYISNYFELFDDFYSSLGWYTLTESENAILLTPKRDFDHTMKLLIKFTEHAGQAYFSVDIG